MNDKLKHSLKNGEVPYDPQAWANLSKRLDQQLPVQKHFLKTGKFAFIAGASSLFVGAGIWFFVNQNHHEKTSMHATKQVEQATNNHTEIHENNTISYSTNNTQTSIKSNTAKTSNNEPFEPSTNTLKSNDLTNENKEQIQEIQFIEKNPIRKQSNDAPVLTYIPVFTNVTYCSNELIEIKNSNSFDIQLKTQQGDVYTIESGKQLSLKLVPGDLTVFVNNSEKEKIDVLPLSDFDWKIEDEMSYLNGLPVYKITRSETVNLFCNKATIQEIEGTTYLIPFKKGNYQITAQKVQSNSCKTQKTEQIEVDVEYDLMAVNSFDPNNQDYRNIRFMPKALELRETPFELYIIDPTSGQVLFRTNDASIGWDGISSQNGQFVGYNKAFIWKVQLKNPLPFEKAEYTGTITLVRKN